MKLNCIIIDDSKSCIKILTSYISRASTELHLVKSYTNPLEALAEIKSGQQIDIVFMDINMPQLNGFQLARLLEDKIRYLIITTSDPSYAIEAFDVNACSYLIKPIPYTAFTNAIDKILKLEQKCTARLKDANHFFIKSNTSELRKIYVNEIFAVQGASNYVQIHTLSQKIYMTYGKMRDYEQNLGSSGSFIRVNKSFIVSVPAIKVIRGKKVTLFNDLQISIGETYREAILNRFKPFRDN